MPAMCPLESTRARHFGCRLVDRTFGPFSQAAPPTALFARGATLSLRKVTGAFGPAALMVGLKLFLHPLVVWPLVTQVIVLELFCAKAAIIFSAGPAVANGFILAQRYEAGAESGSSVIVISRALAMLTISALLLILRLVELYGRHIAITGVGLALRGSAQSLVVITC